MAMGGGVFVTANKKLPGAYINFVSAANASASLADRGFAAMPLTLNWGIDGAAFTVTNDDFIRNSQKIFGYDYMADEMKGLRDLFKNVETLYCYKLNTGVKASNTFGAAKYSGTRGNDIQIVISANVDDDSDFDVKTFLGTVLVDTQTVSTAAGLTNNDYVDFDATATLALTAGTPMTGGTNGAAVTGTAWQAALAALESYSFNVLGCLSTDSTIKDLCIAYTKRMRDEVGVKFQVVVYKKDGADTECCISVENALVGETAGTETGSLVYWVTGAEAACQVNKSCTNKVYNGEYLPGVNYTQTQLEGFLENGKFVFHKVGDEVRVLEDINTLTTVTAEKGEDFKANQTIRVIDQIANDIAVLFNTKFLGIIPNNNAGRITLWNEIVKHHQDLQILQAIENFMPEDVTVMEGNEKKSVVVNDAVTIVNAMAKLYMTCVVA